MLHLISGQHPLKVWDVQERVDERIASEEMIASDETCLGFGVCVSVSLIVPCIGNGGVVLSAAVPVDGKGKIPVVQNSFPTE